MASKTHIETALSRRREAILARLVSDYLASGKPISSAQVAKGLDPRLRASPATIRSELSYLDSQGYVRQPHTSAGRIPTQRGLRYYLERTMSPKLHPWDRKHLDDTSGEARMEELPQRLGQLLAQMTGQVVVVGIPGFIGRTFREIGLASCGPRRVVAYFVSPGDVVQQQVVELDRDLEPQELVRIQNFLNRKLTHRTLSEVRQELRQELHSDVAIRDAFLRLALEVGLRALPEAEFELVVEGRATVATQPDFGDLARLQKLLTAIDDKRALLNILDRMLEGRGVRVLLGGEHAMPAAAELACVGSAWKQRPADDEGVAISLIGPTRMDYSRFVPLIRHATLVLGQRWRQGH